MERVEVLQLGSIFDSNKMSFRDVVFSLRKMGAPAVVEMELIETEDEEFVAARWHEKVKNFSGGM